MRWLTLATQHQFSLGIRACLAKPQARVMLAPKSLLKGHAILFGVPEMMPYDFEEVCSRSYLMCTPLCFCCDFGCFIEVSHIFS